jgi:hypothetical protein
MDIAGGEHGTVAAVDVGFVQATLDAALAAGELLAYLGFHLKSPLCRNGFLSCTNMKPAKTPGDFKFFRISPDQERKTSLVQGLEAS